MPTYKKGEGAEKIARIYKNVEFLLIIAPLLSKEKLIIFRSMPILNHSNHIITAPITLT